MATRAKKPCKKIGCRGLVSYPDRYCDEHKSLAITKDNRPSASKRGYNYTWRKYRAQFLISNPLCVRCVDVGKITKATVVDHIVPHKGDMKLFWKKDNHQALCKRCHDKKTASEDGGFGNQDH